MFIPRILVFSFKRPTAPYLCLLPPCRNRQHFCTKPFCSALGWFGLFWAVELHCRLVLGILLALAHTGPFLNFVLWACCLPELVSKQNRGHISFLTLTGSWGQGEDFLLVTIRECSSVSESAPLCYFVFVANAEDNKKSFFITLLPVLCSAALSLHILPLSPGMPDTYFVNFLRMQS